MSSQTVYIMDEDFWEYRIHKAPLIRRAWVVQERLLARRVIHFNQDQLYWECREKSACEVYARKIPQQLMWENNFKEIVPNMRVQNEDIKGQTDPKTSPELVWRQIMKSYSAAELTNPEDKEAALSGIVKFLEGTFDDTYVAGLLRKWLPFQLVWKIGPQAKPFEKYRAPSWSWLAVDVRETPFSFSIIS